MLNLNDEQGIKYAQEVLVYTQTFIYQSQGSLNKFLLDDKGSTLIAIFGSRPMSHEDDAVRAVICAQ